MDPKQNFYLCENPNSDAAVVHSI